MSDDSDQKEHQASSKKLDDLKRKGSVVRSKDFSGSVLLVLSMIMILTMAAKIKARFLLNIHDAFTATNYIFIDEVFYTTIARRLILDSFYLMIPFYIVIYITVFLPSFVVGGWNFTLEALAFKWEKFDIIKNLSNMYSRRLFVDLTKSLLKFIIISSLAAQYIYYSYSKLFALPYLKFQDALERLVLFNEKLIVVLFMGVIFIAIIDVLYSYYDFANKSKMSTQELKDEAKNAEGSQEVKRKIKSMQLSILRQQVGKMVPTANVIITNPTHYAVALSYREGKDKAPRVVAKGKGMLAFHIRSIAIQHAVPIYPEPVLARAIYKTSKSGKEIHHSLYMAVAIVLTYLNQLKQYQQGRGDLPVRSSNLQIPKELIFDN